MQDHVGGRRKRAGLITDNFRAFWKPTKQTKMEVSPKCGAKGICSQLGRDNHYKSIHPATCKMCCSPWLYQNSAVLFVDLHVPLGSTSGTQVATVGYT